ncbi:MAG: sugar ABC transporter substrate-binding protein [Isosphaeraceae bacterium]
MGETLRATDIDVAGWGKSQSSPRRRGIQPGPCLVLGIAALGVLPGCDSTSFVPSRPPELSPSPTAAAKTSGAAPSPWVPPATTTPAAAAGTKTPATPTVVRARLVELILARPASLDRSYLEQFLRRETGIKKCAFRVYPRDNQPVSPVQLAGEIRTAANRSTGALILEPVDVPEVREALREAESRGLGVVLLDSPLPATSPGKPYPFVTFKGFAEAAKQLVETVADDARVLRLPADGTTLVIENRDQDSYSRDRLESITSALKAAGRAYDIVSFDGEQKGATEVVLEYLKTHPKLTVILADHDFGVAGAFDAREQWKKTNKNIFAIGGYFACDVRLTQRVKDHVQGLVDRNVEGYARKALQVALDLMDGKPVPERALVDVRFIHTPPPFIPPPSSEGTAGNKLEGAVREYPKPFPPAGTPSEPKPKP